MSIRRKRILSILLVGTVLSLGRCSRDDSVGSKGEALSAVEEGYVEVPGGRIWYRKAGNGDGIPLVTLHGGPGYPSYHFESLDPLGDERVVISYDQLGCGKSDRPVDKSLWTIDRFIAELDTLRAALNLEEIHLLGHSWGSMLATDYMLTKPEGVVSLILASPALSVKRWESDAERLLAEMPQDLQEVIAKHEAAGSTDSPEYQAAAMVFLKRHLCRLDPWPEVMSRVEAGANLDLYRYMWGPSEFTATGTLKDYERVDRLSEIKVPTLFTCGRYDEATPETTALYQSRIPGARLVIFENSAHMTMIEEPEHYVSVLRAFLREVEQNRKPGSGS